MSLSAAERVAIAVPILDKVYPNWEDKVNLQILNIRSPYHCVLAQIDGKFDIWKMIKNGYPGNTDAFSDSCRGIHEEWVKTITNRRLAKLSQTSK